ncbi:GNAT family N-acetyltransferase [Lachnoanaerobaculum umeaense]|uniref:GNAT family N-acetyltransferase n=1 Tax=Lachnoanaerobaculum umeaense TaxID=617123 RepID=A0A385Q421_9FIRM|nr:GNAT family N-acetyltransferase [Lachnoanaerobaculum umeaense]AYA99503.1 GNAT family N-acetyltransferase [Lachnoanaerobaculum umeaense]PZW95842.1 RimJ/RimL family protein N-acetyltransferase [Lachnoanaerobaculum umeaense]
MSIFTPEVSIIIKEARPEDAVKLIEYTKIVGAQTDNLSFGKEGAGDTPEVEEFIKRIGSDSKSVMYFAWKNDDIVGCANISSMKRRMSHRANFAISVAKSEWGSGIGSALLEKCISFAKDNEIEIINLDTRSDNFRAISLYKKFGFVKIGRMPAFSKINGEYIDADLMYLDLREKSNNRRKIEAFERLEAIRRENKKEIDFNKEREEAMNKKHKIQP